MTLSLGVGVGLTSPIVAGGSSLTTDQIQALGLRYEGDSLMAGAYGFSTNAQISALLPGVTTTNTAVGGSHMQMIRDRVLDAGNAQYLNRTLIIFDGSPNPLHEGGNTLTVADYVDFAQEAINAHTHGRALIIPPIQPYGSSDTGSSVFEQVRDEMVSRWGLVENGGRVVDWRNWLDHSNGAIAASEFQNPGSDAWHFSKQGHTHIALGVVQTLISKGWIISPGNDLMLSSGSLLMIDFSNPNGAFSGVPGTNDVLPNVAHGQAAALVGGGDAQSLGMTCLRQDTNSGADMFAERTAKGGLHVATTKIRPFNGTNLQGLMFTGASAIRDHMHSTGHDFYVSLWATRTRIHGDPPGGTPATNVAPQSPFHRADSSAGSQFHFQSFDPYPNSSSASQLGEAELPSSSITDGEPMLRALGFSDRSGAVSATRALRIAMGSFDAWGYYNNGAAPDWVLYRAVVEDLTESGRTFAEVAALDEALWINAFSDIGHFGNDSYTDPALAELFTAGDDGLLYMPELPYLYTDAAGTTAASVGDPVGRVLDQSGNNNDGLAPSDGQRPDILQDGVVPYFNCNGVNETIVSTWSNKTVEDFLVVYGQRVTATNRNVLFGYDDAERWQAHTPFTDGNYYFDTKNTSAGRISGSWPHAIGDDVIVAYRRIGSDIIVRTNGVQRGSTTFADSFIAPTFAMFLDGKTSGRCYGLAVVLGTVSDDAMFNAEASLAARIGVTLP